MAYSGEAAAHAATMTDMTATATAVSTKPCVLDAISWRNTDLGDMYLQVFDALAANITLGTTVPKLVVYCPTAEDAGFLRLGGLRFGTACTIYGTTTVGGSTTATGLKAAVWGRFR